MDDVAPLLAELWEPRPIGVGSRVPELGERFELARRRLQRRPELDARVGPDVLERSRARSRELTLDGPAGLAHGDLHPGNVLRADGGRGVVAIGPRPCWGSQAVDAGRRLDHLASRVPDVDTARVWMWCQAMAVIVAAGMLGRRADDPVGDLLRFAGTL